MTVNNDNLLFSSEWDIDQLVASGSVTVSTGDTAIYTISGSVSVPEFSVQLQPTGSSKWYQAGVNSSNAALSGQFTFYAYVTAGALHIWTNKAGTARYFVWADKVDY